MRIAQYGIGHDHAAGKARVMIGSELVDFAGVYEPAIQLRKALSNNPAYTNVRWFSNLEEMMEDSSIDAVAVEGKVSDNLAFARTCLEYGKHVWLDKPAGDNLEDFEEILELASMRKLHLQLGYMFRYNAGFQSVLDWAKSGKLGRIISVRARISTLSSSTENWTRWDSRGERAGGIMFILAGHLIDIVVALLGKPQNISQVSRRNSIDFPWYRDSSIAVMEYPHALAVVESVSGEINAQQSRRLEVYGSRGSAILEPLEPPTLRLCLDANRDGYAAGWNNIEVENRPRYVESLRAFVATIKNQQDPDRSFQHELAVQETILAASGLQSLVLPPS